MFAARRFAFAARSAGSIASKRCVHKGIEGTPPMRYMSVTERVALYSVIMVSFLSYPTYLMINLDNIRPKGENVLGESALAEKERRVASRS